MLKSTLLALQLLEMDDYWLLLLTIVDLLSAETSAHVTSPEAQNAGCSTAGVFKVV